MYPEFEKIDKKGLRFTAIFLIVVILLIGIVEKISKSNQDTYLKTETTPTKAEISTQPIKLPFQKSPAGINAASYLVADLSTGKTIVSKHPEEARPIASLTKLMTGYVAMNKLDLAKKILITSNMISGYGESSDLKSNELWITSDLFYPLLMESSNDAAEALAQAYPAGEQSFISLMNEQARKLGMLSTSFSDPSGLSADDLSSPNDLLRLTMEIEKSKPLIFDISKIRSKTIKTVPGTKSIHNNNFFGDDPSFIGGKTGYTSEAQETMIALFKTKAGHKIAIIILNSQQRESDIGKLLYWVEDNKLD